MKERPILFSGPMVRALLDGTKTQTRRVIKPQPDIADWQDAYMMSPKGGRARFRPVGPDWPDGDEDDVYCPYGKPGDRLWVRETWMECGLTRRGLMQAAFYAADGQTYCDTTASPPTVRKWKPSIHMPRWASRITLEITGVRVERLQNISEADAVAEGVFRKVGDTPIGDMVETATGGQLIYADPSQAREEYRRLWEQINGPGSWAENPWVWVVDFNPLPENAMPRATGPR